MGRQEDQLTAVQARLLDHILDRALEAEPKGVPATECDAAVQDDAARLRHELTYTYGLLAYEGGLYFPTLRAMRRRGDAFADAIAPLQGVLDFGRQILDDLKQPDKIANVDEVVQSILRRFPQLSATPVQRRFNWALFGLHPFVDVQNRSPAGREPKTVQFLPALYRAKSLEDVFREQQALAEETEYASAWVPGAVEPPSSRWLPADSAADQLGAMAAPVPTAPMETAMDKRYEVFISSTFADLADERAKVAQALLQDEFFPAGMELFPASDDSQWKVIQRAIERSDYYVVIVAGRYGSRANDDISYTEKEYDLAVSLGIPVLGFVHRNPDAIPQGKTDKSDDARKRLNDFRDKVRKNRMCSDWENPEELARKVVLAVSRAVRTNPRPGWVRGTVGASEGKKAPTSAAAQADSRSQSKRVRKYIQESARVEFEELLGEVTRKAIEGAASLPTNGASDGPAFLALLDKCEAATAEMVEVAGEAAYWGHEDHHRALLAALEDLASANDQLGGTVPLLQLRAYPALLVFYAAGVAPLVKSDYTLLRKLHALRLLDPESGKKVPAGRILSPDYAMHGPARPARHDGKRDNTPKSDRLFEFLKPRLGQLPLLSDKKYNEAFNRFEYINAIISTMHQGYAYPGRFIWDRAHRSDGNALSRATDEELQNEGENWPPFKAGLFGSDLAAVKAAKTEVDKSAIRMNLSLA